MRTLDFPSSELRTLKSLYISAFLESDSQCFCSDWVKSTCRVKRIPPKSSGNFLHALSPERRNCSGLLTTVIHAPVFVICFLFCSWISGTCLQRITADFIILPPLQSAHVVFSGLTSKLPSCSPTVQNDINQQTWKCSFFGNNKGKYTGWTFYTTDNWGMLTTALRSDLMFTPALFLAYVISDRWYVHIEHRRLICRNALWRLGNLF